MPYVNYTDYLVCVISSISVKTNLPRIPNSFFNDYFSEKGYNREHPY